jgi:ubiquinone/menaquinone biosynthesis C-methylase UbiE
MSIIDIGLVYKWFGDPILSPLQVSAMEYIDPGNKIIDIACGTGAFVYRMAKSAKFVTGIDLSSSMINLALKTKKKYNINNVEFFIKDACHLDDFKDNVFDYATLSMAIHQFTTDLGLKILNELKRIAKEIVIIDYTCPFPRNPYATTMYLIEKLAGKEHYKCFKNYMSIGGIEAIARNVGLEIIASKIRGNGIFTIVKCAGNYVN